METYETLLVISCFLKHMQRLLVFACFFVHMQMIMNVNMYLVDLSNQNILAMLRFTNGTWIMNVIFHGQVFKAYFM